MGLCRLPRTVCERVGERWRDGAGSLATLGYPVTKMLAHMLVWAVDAVDFRPSRNGDGAEAAGAIATVCRVDVTRFRLSRNGDGAAQLSSRNLEENTDCRGLS